jgi:lysophospholipase L1-like esterase
MKKTTRRACLGMLGALALGALPAASALGQASCGCQTERSMALFFGDSITAYTGASDTAHGFTSLIAAGLGVTQDNRGVSGDTLAQTVQVMATVSPPSQYEVVVWLAGFNDNLTHGTDATALATFQAQMTAALLYLTSHQRQPEARSVQEKVLLRQGKLPAVPDGCSVWVGNCIKPLNYAAGGLPPAYLFGSDAGQAAYNVAIAAAVANVAAQGRRVHLVDVASAYNTATMVSGDQVHPNDTGHAYLASTFLTAMAT